MRSFCTCLVLAPMLQRSGSRSTRSIMDFDSPIERPTLTAREAEQIVEQRIEDFGLGALPQISVLEERGDWRITWTARCASPPHERTRGLAWLKRKSVK